MEEENIAEEIQNQEEDHPTIVEATIELVNPEPNNPTPPKAETTEE